jgi:phosphoglycerate dehydrogenase-like enzyme
MTVTGTRAAEGASAAGEVVYLSTLRLPDATLARFSEVPDEMWRRVQVLHTSTTLPEPAQAPRLAWVQLDTSGIDHVVGHPLWTDSSIPVTTIGGVSARWTAEYVVMMLLAARHRLPQMLELQRARDWPSLSDRWDTFLPAPTVGTTCTIVGYGHLGRAIGTMCAAIGMEVVGIRRTAGPQARDESGNGQLTVAGPEELRSALARSDAVVVSVPRTPATTFLLDRAMIEAIRPGAFLVNVSRGGVVDEDALADALRAGRLSGAAVDVFATEPLHASSELWGVPGLVISPHVSGFAGDYLPQVTGLVAENLRRYVGGEPLLNVASREAGY